LGGMEMGQLGGRGVGEEGDATARSG
jgi:hypothetical protein